MRNQCIGVGVVDLLGERAQQLLAAKPVFIELNGVKQRRCDGIQFEKPDVAITAAVKRQVNRVILRLRRQRLGEIRCTA